MFWTSELEDEKVSFHKNLNFKILSTPLDHKIKNTGGCSAHFLFFF